MNPLDYTLCCQTVTVYRKTGDRILRQVLQGCYYCFRDRVVHDELGRRMQRNFLLIAPGKEQSVFAGDRILEGIGPEEVDWNRFIPSLVFGLSEAQYANLCTWEGIPCHTEAGRK